MTKVINITEAQALDAVITLLNGEDMPEELSMFDREEVIEKIEKMADNRRKARARAGRSETPEQRRNREYFDPATLEYMKAVGRPVTCKELTEKVKYIVTVNKASSIFKRLIANGLVAKTKVGKQVGYELVK